MKDQIELGPGAQATLWEADAVTFNLAAPPGFRGLRPELPLKIYTRNLPHWRQQGATYFVTFHLADALPAAKRNELEMMQRDWEARHPPPHDKAVLARQAMQIYRMTEKWLDAGSGQCWFRQAKYASELRRIVLHFHEQRYEIGCFTIMANHCHLIMRPFEGFELEDELGSFKSISARFVNKHEHAAGEVWQQESYDRIIRDEEHLYGVVQYIGSNAQRAGIPPDRWDRWINPTWQKCGWSFAQ